MKNLILDIMESEKALNLVAKSYNALDYSSKLAELLKSVYPSENFEDLPKFELHKLLNRVLLENYHGEQLHKYKLFQNHSSKKNIVAAFEIRVNNSRADFLTINGHTTSYEIKSELDNLSKLSKQIADYLQVFEYNYIVVDERHIERAHELAPTTVGLWSYKNGQYQKRRKATYNNQTKPHAQLKLLTKGELSINFPHVSGNVAKILKTYDKETINTQFKRILKKRYKSRWDFIVKNQEQIFPVDLQFFFNTNISPDHIYHH